MKTRRTGWLLGAALYVSASSVAAQTTHLKLQEMNFDMWCQEHQNLPPARCDKRLPADDAAFQDYANTIERYETQKLNGEARERRVDRMIDSADPIDNPINPSKPQAIQPPR